jgi:hypothetical protein
MVMQGVPERQLTAEEFEQAERMITGGSNSSGNSKVYYYCYYCLSESLRATALSAITG